MQGCLERSEIQVPMAFLQNAAAPVAAEDDVTSGRLGPGLLTVSQAASVVGVHENTIRNWEARGLIRAVRLPGSGHRRFLPSEVERAREGILANLAPATVPPDIELPEGIDLTVEHADGTMD
jgi:excisionase family DNA binding protein